MFAALAGLWWLLAIACGIASLVFFIMVVMEMFKRDQTNLGIVCIVLGLCSGVGMLIAFIVGWMKVTEWNLKKTMTYWTVAFVLQFVFTALVVASIFAAAATIATDELDFDPNTMNFEFEIDDSDFEMPEGFPMPDEGSTEQP